MRGDNNSDQDGEEKMRQDGSLGPSGDPPLRIYQ